MGILISRYSLFIIVFLALMFGVTGCTVSSKDTLAVSQSVNSAEKKVKELIGMGNKISQKKVENFPSQIAILPFSNGTDEEEAPDVMRRVLQGHLSTKSYQMVHWQKVDNLVNVMNLSQADFNDNPSGVMQSFGVDGAIRGKVTEFERVFAGVYAQISLAVYIELIDLQGNVLWFGEFDVTTRAGGLSETPWGILLNVALAAMHLDDENIFVAADELARDAALVMPEPARYVGNNGPVIQSVIHDGARKVLRYGDVVKIGLRGEPGMQASALVGNLDVVELNEAESGFYFGELPISKAWNFEEVMITGRLLNNAGIASKRISEVGLLDIDNVAPAKVTAFTASAGLNHVQAQWQDSAEYYRLFEIDTENKLIGEFTAAEARFETTNSAFSNVKLGLVALDEAGNESDMVFAEAVVYPNADINRAKQVRQLPTMINETVLLRSATPVIVDKNVTITEQGVLYIFPGTELQYARDGNLMVQGRLHIYGATKSVIFSANGPQIKPKGFITVETNQTVEVSGAEMWGADVAVTANKGTMVFSDVNLLNNNYSAFMLSGTASLKLFRVKISDSNTSGIVLSEQAKLSVTASQFDNNQPFHIQNSSLYPVSAPGNQWLPEANSTTILGEVAL